MLDGGGRVHHVPDRLRLLRAARRRCMVGRSPDAPPLPEEYWRTQQPAPSEERFLALFRELDSVRACYRKLGRG